MLSAVWSTEYANEREKKVKSFQQEQQKLLCKSVEKNSEELNVYLDVR